MYICVCNAVTDKQIANAVSAGADTLAKLQKELRVATCCGSCTKDVESFLTKANTYQHIKPEDKPGKTGRLLAMLFPGKIESQGTAS
jgi:bacterioferritin-associated ferredoxin